MQEEILPKILSISLSTWRKDSGIHTQTDLFKFWEIDRLAQTYVKADLPNTPVCDKFFQISENAVIKSIFNRKMVGKEVKNTEVADEKTQIAMRQEKALYAHARKRHSWFMTIMREIVWAMGCWKSKALDKFVEEVNPDVYFVPLYPVVYMGWIQLHILKKYPRPYVCYLMDDNYSYAACGYNPLAYIHRFMLRKVIKKLSVNCNKMFAITETGARETDSYFGTKSIILTKGINYSNLSYKNKEVSTPIRMVYTGKLVIGRAVSLAAISKAMGNLNRKESKITMDIYSPDVVDAETMKLLNSNGCRYHGQIAKEKVELVQNEADIVVFVESLEKKFRYAARLSFSTKLTDYFKSGKCIFAIGDKTIAPIEYLKQNDAAVIATDYAQIEERLRMLVEDKEKIKEYGQKAFDCGKKNHDEDQIRERFVQTFKEAAREKSKMRGYNEKGQVLV